MTLAIHKQPSGGRGEYEIVGEQGTWNSGNLVDHEFVLRTPYGDRELNVWLLLVDGKRRLRSTEVNTRDRQLIPQLAAFGMLPHPTRSERLLTNARPVILEGRYLLNAGFDIVHSRGDRVWIEPTTLDARSEQDPNTSLVESIDWKNRLAEIDAVYSNSARLPTPARSAVDAHGDLAKHQAVVPRKMMASVKAIMKALEADDSFQYVPDGDPLPALRYALGITTLAPPMPLPSQLPIDASAIRARVELNIRLTVARGSSARRFSQAVNRAYMARCAFCGFQAPGVPGLARTGVDSAHIVPWATHDLDVVSNGLALCGVHHWAFDHHVLLLGYEDGQYIVSLNEEWVDQANPDQRSVDQLKAVCGAIPEDRLPRRARDRPNREYIDKFYEGRA